MNVRRYTGRDEARIRQEITRELGEHAVIVDWRTTRRGGWLFGRRNQHEVIVAIDEPNHLPVHSGPPDLDRLLKLQRDQFMGIRRTLKVMDDRVVGLEGRLRLQALAATSGGPDLLDHVHPGWLPRIADLAYELTDGEPPDEQVWHQALSSLIPAQAGLSFRRETGRGPAVYCLVGPTGVGKTTTLAKLAARCVLVERLNVGIITLDTFRIGAVDQVREYADLLGVAVHVAFSPQEMEAALASFADKDLVFVDTPGRSQYDQTSVDQIGAYLSAGAMHVALVVPAGVSRTEAPAIAEAFAVTRPEVLILTKLDEASCCDGLTCLLDDVKLPIVYLTDGQRVPEDIFPATSEQVAATILKLSSFQHRVQQGGKAA